MSQRCGAPRKTTNSAFDALDKPTAPQHRARSRALDLIPGEAEHMPFIERKGFVDYFNRVAPINGVDANRTLFHVRATKED